MPLCPQSQSHPNDVLLQPINHPNEIFFLHVRFIFGFSCVQGELLYDFICIYNTRGALELHLMSFLMLRCVITHIWVQ